MAISSTPSNSGTISSTPSSSTSSSVSPYLQPYVNNMLTNTQNLTSQAMPDYTGQLTAGTSQLQGQAWNGLTNLVLPSDLTNAGQNLGAIAGQAANAGSTFTPTNFTNTYSSPGAYNGTQSTNQYTPTNTYNGMQASTQNFTGNDPNTGNSYASEYMNPYLAQSLSPQLQLLQQQLGAQNAKSNAQLAQSGAFGGGRTAIENSQNALNTNLATNQLISQGYNTAFNNAQQAFTADQARQLQAQQANIGQQQFGAQQGLANTQNAAQYGQAAQAANVNQQQFGAQQALTEAQQTSQALQAQQAAQEGATQYGSTLGLQGLQAATTAEQAQANAGTNEAQYNLANTQALSTAGNTQQAQNQAALTAQYNQYLAQLQYPQTMLKLQSTMLQGLPGTTTSTYAAQPTAFQSLVGTAGGVASLVTNLKSAGLTGTAINNFINGLKGPSPDSNNTPIDTSTGINVGGQIMQYTPATGTGPNGTPGTGQVLGQDGKIYNDPSYAAGVQSFVPSGVTIDSNGIGSDGVDYGSLFTP